MHRPPIFGPELWARIGDAEWSHWDLWFCLVVETDFAGDWRALERAIVGQRRDLCGGRDWEAKDSHLHDVERRLASAGLDARALVAQATDGKALLANTRRKVLTQSLSGRDITPAMRDTPRRRLQRRAMRGHWDAFPVSPGADCEAFADLIEGQRTGRRGSFGVAIELEETVSRLDGERSGVPEGRLALWRALVTAGMEAFEGGLRDSDGEVARTIGMALARYTALPWEVAGPTPLERHTDLCELCVWDQWGLLFKRETAPFRTVRPGDVTMVEEILLHLADEHRALHLTFQADEALQLIAWLHVAARSYDRFVAAAHRLGCDWWMPVVAMAEKAADAGRTDLAADVLDAAVEHPGMHRELLLETRVQLCRPHPSRRQHLRVLK